MADVTAWPNAIGPQGPIGPPGPPGPEGPAGPQGDPAPIAAHDADALAHDGVGPRVAVIEEAPINAQNPPGALLPVTPSNTSAEIGARLQAMLDAIPDSLVGQLNQTGGGALYLPGEQAIYVTDRTLLAKANGTRIFGDGHGATHLAAGAAVFPAIKTDEARNSSIEDIQVDGGVWLTQPNDGMGEANNYLRRARVRATSPNHVYAVRIGNADGTLGMGCHVGADCIITHTEATVGRAAIEVYGPDCTLLNPRVTSYYGPAVLIDSKADGGGGTQVMGGHYFGITKSGAAAVAFRIRGGNIIQLHDFYLDNYRQGPAIIVDPPLGQGVRDLRIGPGTPLTALPFRDATDVADVDAQYPLIKLDTSGGGAIESVVVGGLVGNGPGAASRWSYVVDASPGVRWSMEESRMRDVALGLYNPAGPPARLR